MPTTPTVPSIPPETTDLERRVLAHERILQSLIAFMSRADPRFVEHLRARFVEPMAMVRHEHDYRDVDDYAEEFIRAVMRMTEGRLPDVGPKVDMDRSIKMRPEIRNAEQLHPDPDRVQLNRKGGIWELKVDGTFRGHYHLKEQGLAAAALAKLSLQ